ncbi:MAG: sugar phosphate isomerase/epimerase family protein [Anaerolineae bacterium]|nr:sugar phosphate isomerase/epimerase [Thermoflexales bacterium]MDW8407670.1 sugar phosphate isomerase/epimerase family protein [Anaerolineae bacterium]
MALSLTTDYAADTGNPEPYLRRIAEAGFSHIHWCHHWNTDFIYLPSEIAQIKRWLRTFGLQLLDTHGSDGKEKRWASPFEYERLAGVELVKNRIDFTAALGGDAVVMHIPDQNERADNPFVWDQVRRSLDELEPYTRAQAVRIAIENTGDGAGNYENVHELLATYAPDFLGVCYDCGHGALHGRGLDQLEAMKDRLIAVHLHDNDGLSDLHRLPFTGIVDWARLAAIIKCSSYHKCISLESNMRHEPARDEQDFLARAFAAGTRLTRMIVG